MLSAWKAQAQTEDRQVKFLIVDDHLGTRELIHDLVRHVTSQVQKCASGEEAVALCKTFSPDCVTMDLRMASMHGLAAVQHIRQLHPTTNIVVVTQFDHDTLRERAQRVGADGYITKDNLTMLKRYVESLTSADE